MVQLFVCSNEAAPDLGLLGANVHDLRRGIQLLTFWRTDFWNMTPFSLVDKYRRFEARAATMFRIGGAYLSIWRWRQHTSETSKLTNQIIGCHFADKYSAWLPSWELQTTAVGTLCIVKQKTEVNRFVFSYSFATEYNGGKQKLHLIVS